MISIKLTQSVLRKVFFSGLLMTALAISGCSHLGVKPWDRDLLAKPEMALNPSPVEAGLDDHIYFSKEATSGGRGYAGGGCGCN